MQKLARLFLLCLMMIAIPVQGVAAATMLYCGAQQQPTTIDANDHHQQHSSDTGAMTDECSSCAACCIGCCAMEASAFSASHPSSEKIHFSFSSHPGHIEDGPLRPPRT